MDPVSEVKVLAKPRSLTMEYVRRILIVEDDRKYGKTVLRHLRREAFTVELVTRGDGAIHEIQDAFSKELPIDLIIMNTSMLANDGRDLLAWVHHNHPDISVILVSACEQSDEAIEHARPELDDYDRRPMNPERMMELIDAVERKRRCTWLRTKLRSERENLAMSEEQRLLEGR